MRLLAVLLFCVPLMSAADDLTTKLTDLDRAVFDSYNRCDLDKFRDFFSEDVEFYHDQGGFTRGIDTLVVQLRQNICGKVRRELVASSMQVFPMKNFGAVQSGIHRFYQAAVGPAPTGEARFFHLWQEKDGKWKIIRVISYDHRALPQPPAGQDVKR